MVVHRASLSWTELTCKESAPRVELCACRCPTVQYLLDGLRQLYALELICVWHNSGGRDVASADMNDARLSSKSWQLRDA